LSHRNGPSVILMQPVGRRIKRLASGWWREHEPAGVVRCILLGSWMRSRLRLRGLARVTICWCERWRRRGSVGERIWSTATTT
jgi:hypothetical protein